MEVIQQPTRGHRQLQKQLQADPAAYVESVGKHDKRDIAHIASRPTPEGTVLRLFFGATTEMPLRGLSYVAAAQAIGRHVVHEQLQVIFVHGLGAAINGIDATVARRQAMQVRDVMRRQLEQQPGSDSSVLFAEDTIPDTIRTIQPDIHDIIQADPAMLQKLSAKGSKHGGDYVQYAAAHVVHQETALMQPVGLTAQEPAAVQPQRIISIGCQQEHLFYDLRMRARQDLTDLDFLPTAQIFTKHVQPPYYMARGGEQSLDDALVHGVNLSLMRDLSAGRDVDHLLQIIPQSEIRL